MIPYDGFLVGWLDFDDDVFFNDDDVVLRCCPMNAYDYDCLWWVYMISYDADDGIQWWTLLWLFPVLIAYDGDFLLLWFPTMTSYGHDDDFLRRWWWWCPTIPLMMMMTSYDDVDDDSLSWSYDFLWWWLPMLMMISNDDDSSKYIWRWCHTMS